VSNKCSMSSFTHYKTLQLKTSIVISLSKIRDRDWSYTRHVICRNNQCCPCINIPGQHSCSRATVPGNMTSRTSSHAFAADFWSERYIKQIKYIFCAALVDIVSVDVTVVSSLKGLKSRFILSFANFKEFKNVKII